MSTWNALYRSLGFIRFYEKNTNELLLMKPFCNAVLFHSNLVPTCRLLGTLIRIFIFGNEDCQITFSLLSQKLQFFLVFLGWGVSALDNVERHDKVNNPTVAARNSG